MGWRAHAGNLRTAGWGLVLGVFSGGLASFACLLELEGDGVACGDGDVAVGAEACDPAAKIVTLCESSDVIVPCDPVTCRLDRSVCDRPVCGDGRVQAPEECEPGVLATPGGFQGGSLRCVDLVRSGAPYVGGTYRCTDGCRIDVSRCDTCGNGVIEPAVDGRPAEQCEPGKIPIAFRRTQCQLLCAGRYPNIRPEHDVWCDAPCENCMSLELDPDSRPLRCCEPTASPQADPRVGPSGLEPCDDIFG